MSKTPTSPIDDLIAAVELESIRIVDSQARTSVEDVESLGESQLKIDLRTDARRAENDGPITALVLLDLQLRANGATEPKVTVRAEFHLRYGLPAALSTPPEVLKEFSATNALYNAWPYWRQFVQDSIARMGLPPLIVPLLKIGRRPTEAGTNSAATSPHVTD